MNKKAKLIAIIPGIIALMVGIVIIGSFLIKVLWAWTIPDLFPGAVEQGLIASEISWFTSFKLAIFFGILSGSLKGKAKYKSD
tara:strand:+ start:354 stop:602 length:249 start_codon:yes stop_codon:yes gene_type:complete